MRLAQLAQDLGYAVSRAFAVTPKGAEGGARLDAYWIGGEGAAKIRWQEPCAFCRCKTHLGKYIQGDKLDGHCANLEKRATGHWPNPQHNKTKHCPC